MIYVRNKRVLVLGAGRSGQAVSELLVQNGASVLLYDNNTNLNENRELTEGLEKKGISYLFDEGPAEDLSYDFCVLSPGIALSAPVLDNIRRKVFPVSEIEVAFWFAGSPVIGITGSNGKSTVTTLAHLFLSNSNVNAVACGNIGYSFSRAVLDHQNDPEKPVYVVECSSFQLEHVYLFSPNAAVMINITPDHLDRYRSFYDYRTAKMNILNHQSRIQQAVLNLDDGQVRDFARTKGEVIPVSLQRREKQKCWYDGKDLCVSIEGMVKRLPADRILLPGKHNRTNIMLAATAVLNYVPNERGIFRTLQEFSGIPHRLEHSGEINGAACYNDSKATNLDSVTAALESFPGSIHLILGGKDKNGDFTVLIPYLNRCKAVYVIGQAAEKIADHLHPFPVQKSGTLENAVKDASEKLEAGDVLLLSPGCASFDQFRDFEDRGDKFKEIVRRYQ